jgi:nicotinamidase-related amidase
MSAGLLAIIDMQVSYPAANNYDLCRSICDRIRLHKGPVAMVTWANDGEVFADIQREWEAKPNKFAVTKKQNDGSAALCLHINRNQHLRDLRTFVLVGVNTPYCVLETAHGILKRRPASRVVIPFDCVRSQHDDGKKHESEAALSVFLRENRKRRKVEW